MLLGMNNKSVSFIALAFAFCASSLFAATDPVRVQVKFLAGIFCNGQVTKTKSTEPMKMIFRYLYTTYNEEDVKEFKIVRNAESITCDEKIAGTLTVKGAIQEVRGGIDYMLGLEDIHTDVSAADKAKWKGQCDAALRKLVELGCSFGFDGLRQNEGPTPYLLICDPKSKTVYGLELTPSEF